MKLSSAYIADKISEYCNVVKQNRISGEDAYLRPVFMYKKELSGHVVVVDSEEEPEEYRDVFYIFAGVMPQENLSAAYICIEEKNSALIFNMLTDIFDTCDAWVEKLRNVVIGNGTIGKILKISSEFLGNPLTVMGQDFTFVADAGTENIPDDFRIFADENVNSNYMNEMIQYKTVQKEAHGPVMYPAFIGGCRTIGMNLQVGGQDTHRVVLTEALRPFSEGSFCILRELAVYLEFMLSHIPAILEKSGLEDIFLTAITDRKADYMQVSRKLNQLGWGVKHEYLCLILQILYEDESSMTIYGIRKYMKKQFPDSCSFEFEGYIITYFNLTKLSMETEEIESKLTYFIRDSYLKAGYSRVVRGHMGIRRQFLQAKIALEVGSRVKPYIWIYRFNQMVVPYMFEQTTKVLPGRMLCHEGVLELHRMDEELHTQYVQTLRTYLDNQLNATKTANDLFIHRSTFLYRIDKIKEILESNLDDPEDIFYLNYSLRLLEME